MRRMREAVLLLDMLEEVRGEGGGCGSEGGSQ